MSKRKQENNEEEGSSETETVRDFDFLLIKYPLEIV
jgi:hypothetical protein